MDLKNTTCRFECIYQFTTPPPIKVSILNDKQSFDLQFPDWNRSAFKRELEFNTKMAKKILKRKLKVKEDQIETSHIPFIANFGNTGLIFDNSIKEIRFLVTFTVKNVSEKLVKSETSLQPFFPSIIFIFLKF